MLTWMNEWMARWVDGYACFGNFSESGGNEKRHLQTQNTLERSAVEVWGRGQLSKNLR